jgi:histone deacetylase 11
MAAIYSKSSKYIQGTLSAKIPIIYSSKYNMRFFGIENFHPIDTKKFKKIYNSLIKRSGLKKNQFYKPSPATDAQLKTVHTDQYLKSLRKSKNIAYILELYVLAIFPNILLRKKILNPIRYATGGTILGLKLALEYGWAINLSGGYHHAKPDKGDGFCVFADIPIAVKLLLREDPNLKVLIIDFDAHQGNGHSFIFREESRVAILDIYNSDIFPNDLEAEKYAKFRVPIYPMTEDEEYLELIEKWVPISINEHQPDIIIYNAGTDVSDFDTIGFLSISEPGIIKRDEMVFKYAFENDIPILMVLSGGYQKKSWFLIWKSIDNLLKRINKDNVNTKKKVNTDGKKLGF